VPERRPRLSSSTRSGIIALVKTVANSAATVATAKPRSAMTIPASAPGAANHSEPAPRKRRMEKLAIQGFRAPVASATAPRTGESRAIVSPATPVA
jgi:hypothetical protein